MPKKKMVKNYKERLNELKIFEKVEIKKSLKNRDLKFLMAKMNEMYSKEIYNNESLSCGDCVNQIYTFWKIWAKKN